MTPLRAIRPPTRPALAALLALLLATIDLHALFNDHATPGWLLHTLTGGRMKAATHTLQQLVDGHRRHGWTIRLAPPRRDLDQPPDPGPPRLPIDDPGSDPP